MMNRRSFIGSLVAGSAMLATGSVFSFGKDKKDEGNWEDLGTLSVSKREDKDTIKVNGKGKYTALRFRVEDGTIEMDHIEVVFESGKSFTPETKLVFKEGERSQDIDLPGEKRSIKAIHFTYRSLGKGEAKILVRGKAA